jgi:subtilisin family serine protease
MSLIDSQFPTTPTEKDFSNENIPIYKSSNPVSSSNLSTQSNGVSYLTQYYQFQNDNRFKDIDGQGFSTVIIDTGIDLNHPFFGSDKDNNGIADRIVYQYDFADGDVNASDKDGHGTLNSSIVASSSPMYTGVAPQADIISLKVFKDDGSGSFDYVEEALQWVVANAKKYNIASVNISLGDSSNYAQPTQQYGLGDEIANLAGQQVAVVSAAGNNFNSNNGEPGLVYPAADPNVIPVGAVYAGNVGSPTYPDGSQAYSTAPDRIASYSQRNQRTIFAPGEPITGAGAYGNTITLGGTSQAAPHVSGAIVLAQQLAVQELGRRLNMYELKSLLSSTGDTIVDGDNEQDNVTNTNASYKRLDILALGEEIYRRGGGGTNAPNTGGNSTGSSYTNTPTPTSTYQKQFERKYDGDVDSLTGFSKMGTASDRSITDLKPTKNNSAVQGDLLNRYIDDFISDRSIFERDLVPDLYALSDAISLAHVN